MTKVLVFGLVGFLIIGFVYFTIGLFVIQPIGLVPDGRIIVYWRLGTGLPFISSADGLLLKAGVDVSLLSRIVAMKASLERIVGRKIVLLPYSKIFYLISTGGIEFKK